MWLEKIDSAKHAIAVKSIEAKLKENMSGSNEDYNGYEDNDDLEEDNLQSEERLDQILEVVLAGFTHMGQR